MKFEIHYELGYDEHDYFIVEGDTVEEIRQLADEGVSRRNGKNPYSVEITEP